MGCAGWAGLFYPGGFFQHCTGSPCGKRWTSILNYKFHETFITLKRHFCFSEKNKNGTKHIIWPKPEASDENTAVQTKRRRCTKQESCAVPVVQLCGAGGKTVDRSYAFPRSVQAWQRGWAWEPAEYAEDSGQVIDNAHIRLAKKPAKTTHSRDESSCKIKIINCWLIQMV